MHTFEFATYARKMPTKCSGSHQNGQAVGGQEEMGMDGRERCVSQMVTDRQDCAGRNEGKGRP